MDFVFCSLKVTFWFLSTRGQRDHREMLEHQEDQEPKVSRDQRWERTQLLPVSQEEILNQKSLWPFHVVSGEAALHKL